MKYTIWPMRKFLLLFLCLISYPLLSQSPNLDSLHRVVSTSTGIKKLDGIIELSRTHAINDNYDSGVYYAGQAFRLSTQLGDSLRLTKSGRLKGMFLRVLEDYDSALYYLKGALYIARRNNFKEEAARMGNSMGIIYIYSAKYDLALNYCLESLAYYTEMGMKEDMSYVLNNVAVTFYKMKNYEKALDYFKESVRIKEESHHTGDIDVTLINIGHCYAYLGNLDAALKAVEDGLSKCGSNCSEHAKTLASFARGVAYLNTKNFDKAYYYFDDGLRRSERLGDNRLQGDNLLCLGKVLIAENKVQEGIEKMVRAEEISKQYGYNELLLSVYEGLINAFTLSNEPAGLVEYQRKYIRLREEVYSASLLENVSREEGKLLRQQNELVLKQQQETIALNTRLIEKQQLLILATVFAGLLLVVVGYFYYRSSQLNKRLNKELENQVYDRTGELLEAFMRGEETQNRQLLDLQNVNKAVRSHYLTMKGLHGLMPSDLSLDDKKRSIEQSLKQLGSSVLPRLDKV